jgi:putative CocE/NonD family hydrolase
MLRNLLILSLIAASTAVFEGLALAQNNPIPNNPNPPLSSFPPLTGPIRERYTKTEYMIPMRDGVKLYTAVYAPKDVSCDHPILMERTPYSAGPYGPGSFPFMRGSIKLQQAEYIFAFQDVRGKYMSEGDYVNIRPELAPGQPGIDESTDTYDTVDYLIRHVPHNNGHVGLWGISYPGFYAGVGGVNSHPALTAVSPQAPVSNWFIGDDFHHNGAFFLQDAFDFLQWFGQKRPTPGPQNPPGPAVDRGDKGAYDFFLQTGALPNFDANYFKGSVPFWNDMMNHPIYDDWWKIRSLPDHMNNVKCAVLAVGGWFDAEDMWGALNLYKKTKEKNPTTPVFLAMGPWFHGMWAYPNGTKFGDLNFGSNTSAYYQNEIEFPFFEKYLRAQNIPAPAGLTLFNTGADSWRKFDSWPPANLTQTNEYLAPNGALSASLPKPDGADSYVNDPANPTPYEGDPKIKHRNREYMVDDQRWADGRSDVLTYRATPMTKDTTVAGPIDVDFFVSTTGTDADFVVKVIDVWPSDAKETGRKDISMANYEEELRADIFRGKFRESFSRPKPFVPGKPTKLHFKLNDVLHTFLKGHRMEIQVQSDWFPLVDRNPNVFEDIYTAKDTDFQKATITLYRTKAMPSHIAFGVEN